MTAYTEYDKGYEAGVRASAHLAADIRRLEETADTRLQTVATLTKEVDLLKRKAAGLEESLQDTEQFQAGARSRDAEVEARASNEAKALREAARWEKRARYLAKHINLAMQALSDDKVHDDTYGDVGYVPITADLGLEGL